MKCLLTLLNVVVKRENVLNGCRSTMNLSDMHLQGRPCNEWISTNHTQVITFVVQYIVSRTRAAFMANTTEDCLTKNQLLSVGSNGVNTAMMFDSP